MPVEGNTQPYGLLHGGASAVLAETLGSVGAMLHGGARQHRRRRGPQRHPPPRHALRHGHRRRHARPPRAVLGHVRDRDHRRAGKRVCTARLTCMLRPATPPPHPRGPTASSIRPDMAVHQGDGSRRATETLYSRPPRRDAPFDAYPVQGVAEQLPDVRGEVGEEVPRVLVALANSPPTSRAVQLVIRHPSEWISPRMNSQGCARRSPAARGRAIGRRASGRARAAGRCPANEVAPRVTCTVAAELLDLADGCRRERTRRMAASACLDQSWPVVGAAISRLEYTNARRNGSGARRRGRGPVGSSG